MSEIVFKPRPRKIPFELQDCLKNYPDGTALIANLSRLPGGTPWVLLRLAFSVSVEYAERIISWLDNNFLDKSLQTEDERNFIKQENLHAAYHQQLNKLIAPQYVMLKYAPIKCNALIFPSVSRTEALHRRIVRPTSLAEKQQAVRDLAMIATVFEFNFGVFGAIAFCEYFEKHLDQFIAHDPFFAYLYLYHYTEEMEHVECAIDTYRHAFNCDPREENDFKTFTRELSAGLDQSFALGIAIGLKHGFTVHMEEIAKDPIRRRFEELSQRFADSRNIQEFAALRMRYIKKFDEVWEPLLRKAVLENLKLKKSA